MKGTQNAKRLYDSSQFPEDKKLGSHLLSLKDEVVFELDITGNVLTGSTMQNSSDVRKLKRGEILGTSRRYPKNEILCTGVN